MLKKSLLRIGIVAAVIALVGIVGVVSSGRTEQVQYKKVRTGKVFRIDSGTLIAKGLLEKTGISKDDSTKYPPELAENWVFKPAANGKVEVTGNAAIRFKEITTWEINAPQVQELNDVDTPWGRLYVGRLDGNVVTKKGTELLTMKVIYKPETDQIKINAVVGTVGDPLMLQFGESFVSEKALYDFLAEQEKANQSTGGAP